MRTVYSDITAVKKKPALDAAEVKRCIMEWPGIYETEGGIKFYGMPASQVPSQLIRCGWKNVSNLQSSEFKKLGLEVLIARYVGGVRPKRFCDVVVAKRGSFKYNEERMCDEMID